MSRTPLLLLLAGASALPGTASSAIPDRVFVNGQILTMDSRARIAEAVAVRNGEITSVGSNTEIRSLVGTQTVVTDLGGKTMLPGLYAAHDHFPSLGIVALFQVNLNSPPMGEMQCIGDVVAALREKAANTPPGQWIVGRGYDDTLLREKRHPNRFDLDGASTNHPIVIIHTSGHLSACNSLALSKAGVTKATPQPKGGVIRKDAATGEPIGVFEETGIVSKHAPAISAADKLEGIRWADRYYLSNGVTTTVIAGGSLASARELAKAMASGDLHLRVANLLAPDARLSTTNDRLTTLSRDRLHLAAGKIWHDGSIQGFTGYLSRPYYRQPEGTTNYCGYPMRSREALMEQVKKLHQAGFQIAIHGNGDAAIDDILAAYAEAQREFPRTDARHRIEHCQTAREDQLDRMKELGVTPSFFVGHVFYWGDRHRDIFLGPERGARISPLASALKRGVAFTVHDDTPVTPVNPLQLVWVSVNRLTRAGVVLGPEQRIAVIEALRAITSDAAWQNFEERRKGSIEPGKLADFTVIDRNPLTIPSGELRKLRVLETVIGGATVYP